MTREELIKEITPIVQEIFQDKELKIEDGLNATSVSAWTSLSFMQLLTSIEEKYEFKFKMMELLRLKNMGAVLDATLTHLG